ncbi:uncharacterized protein LOC141856618 [Brevipalpus obovatus]|uniref:uncharacterized protein LOC141856618 n=1 Tax=Brevipalpus obovatus TaxID=246614 RepID=UPI003D9EC963
MKMKFLIVAIVILLTFLLRTSSSSQSSSKSTLNSENVKSYARSSSSSLKQDEMDEMYQPEDIDKLRRALSTMSSQILDRMRVRVLERVITNPNDAEKERAYFLAMKNSFLETVHQLNESLPIVVEEINGVYGLSTIVNDLSEFQDLRYQGYTVFSAMMIITWWELIRYFVFSSRDRGYATSSPALERQYVDYKNFENKIMKSMFDPINIE